MLKRLLLSVILLLISSIAIALLVYLFFPRNSRYLETNCIATEKGSVECEIKNKINSGKGTFPMKACGTIVVICPDGEHIKTFCTGTVAPQETKNIVISDFYPPIKNFGSCQNFEIRDYDSFVPTN
ncbi:hypothetical protein [Geminocystis sp.]|uniref:hypothetical protein n=1 Tax=Geminocystis sp. TaxID=2664100 RepID=UPI00359314B4